ncbi:hypothetical protein GCM10009772_48260 [Pseudonocardia alni subsp. carboxydivorans]
MRHGLPLAVVQAVQQAAALGRRRLGSGGGARPGEFEQRTHRVEHGTPGVRRPRSGVAGPGNHGGPVRRVVYTRRVAHDRRFRYGYRTPVPAAPTV